MAAEAKQWAALTSNLLTKAKDAHLKNNMLDRFRDNGVEVEEKEEKNVVVGKKSKSVALFLNHRREEMSNELRQLEDFILHIDQSPSSYFKSSKLKDLPQNIKQQLTCCLLLIDCLSYVLYFGFNGYGDCESNSDTVDNGIPGLLINSLKQKFGLNFLTYIKHEEASIQKIIRQKLIQAEKKLSTKIIRIFSIGKNLSRKEGQIDFDVLFDIRSNCTTKDKSIDSVDFSDPYGYGLSAEDLGIVSSSRKDEIKSNGSNNIPIHLEICSGNGEWVCAQAAESINRGILLIIYNLVNHFIILDPKSQQDSISIYWVALELRCDRVHNTLCQYVFSNPRLLHIADSEQERLHNLAIIGGDAAKIIPERFPANEISAIFINHPQPPERSGGRYYFS
jgi:hypothetical protein